MKMSSRIRTMLAFSAMLCAPWLAQAHHSPTSYDMSRDVEVKGVFKVFRFENPHITMELEASDANGKLTVWKIESLPPGWFRKAGIRVADFKKAVGQPVTITLKAGKDGAPVGWFQKITFQDGTYIQFADVFQ